MAFSSVDPSQRDEFLAFASLVRSQSDVQQKLYTLETRNERVAYIQSLGFNPETLSSVINSIEFEFAGKKVTYKQWLQLKGVSDNTPLPLNVIVSAMRKSGYNNAYDQLTEEIEQYINELSGYSGGAGTSVRKTTTTRAVKTDTEAVDTAGDLRGTSDKGMSEESQDFVGSNKETSDNSEAGESSDKSGAAELDKGLNLSSEKFESSTQEGSKDSNTETRSERADKINEQVDKYSSEHSDLQSSFTPKQSRELSKEATDYKDAVNEIKERYDKGEISRTQFYKSLSAETNRALDKAAEIAPHERGGYEELKDGLEDAIKSAESGNESKGTDEGDESGDKGSDGKDGDGKDSDGKDKNSDGLVKGLKDPDVWIAAVVGAVGIEALKAGKEALYNLYKDNS